MHNRTRSKIDGTLLAEAVRVYEEERGAVLHEPEADARGRAAGGDLERRIIARARSLSLAKPLAAALRHLRATTSAGFGVAVICALAAGAGAAGAFFGSPPSGPVNFFQVLAGLLGIPTLALLAWILFMLVRPKGAAIGGLGNAVMALGGRLTRWMHGGPLSLVAARATRSMFAGGGIGRWTIGTISHTLWLAYAIGALALAFFYLSTREFTFAWETTILTERHYVILTRTIAFVPSLFGFPTPEAADVASSQRAGDILSGEGARGAWAGLLIGCLVVYGVLPRVLLLGLCLITMRRAMGRYRLDVSLPGYARLLPLLLPASQPKGVVDAERTDQIGENNRLPETLAIRREGPVALIGLEMGPPAGGWPPAIRGVDWLDFGLVDDRSSRHRVVDQVRRAAVQPRAIAVVCVLDQTPDRGNRAFLDDLQRSTGVPALLLLSGGQRLRARGRHERVAERVNDWRRMAAGAGIPENRVIEVDLDRLTEVSRDQLARWFGAEGGTPATAPPIEHAFALIVEHAGRWRGAPGTLEQAELHRDIARIHGSEAGRWRDLLRLPFGGGLPESDGLRAGAAGMVALLPARLKKSRRWMAVGALAGALACVAAATLVAPAAIAALPAWAGLGAGVAAALRWPGAVDPAESSSDGEDLSRAVAAAALFALVLQLQGRDEGTISEILDEVLEEETPPVMRGSEEAQAWLVKVAGQLKRALASRRSVA
jgi:hypothetical protein